MLLCYILDVYLSFLFVYTESLTLVSDPTSRRFIRWLLFQTFIYIYIYSDYVIFFIEIKQSMEVTYAQMKTILLGSLSTGTTTYFS